MENFDSDLFQKNDDTIEYEAERAFCDVVDDMIVSPVVISEKKIKSLLKCIAYYDELRAVVDIAKNGFEYDDTMERCLVGVGDAVSFRMPMSAKEKVAFVICLLLEFDSGKRDFFKFISTCFPAPTNADSFNLFCQKALNPFKVAFRKIFENGDSDDFVDAFLKENVEFVSEGLKMQTEYLLFNFSKSVQEADLQDVEREKLLIMIEALSTALDLRDPLLIKGIWFGIEQSLKSKKMCKEDLEDMEDALKLYMVLK